MLEILAFTRPGAVARLSMSLEVEVTFRLPRRILRRRIGSAMRSRIAAKLLDRGVVWGASAVSSDVLEG